MQAQSNASAHNFVIWCPSCGEYHQVAGCFADHHLSAPPPPHVRSEYDPARDNQAKPSPSTEDRVLSPIDVRNVSEDAYRRLDSLAYRFYKRFKVKPRSLRPKDLKDMACKIGLLMSEYDAQRIIDMDRAKFGRSQQDKDQADG